MPLLALLRIGRAYLARHIQRIITRPVPIIVPLFVFRVKLVEDFRFLVQIHDALMHNDGFECDLFFAIEFIKCLFEIPDPHVSLHSIDECFYHFVVFLLHLLSRLRPKHSARFLLTECRLKIEFRFRFISLDC